jgi:hypothetical protein
MAVKKLMLVAIMILSAMACSRTGQNESDVFLYKNSLDIEYGKDICSYSNEVIKKVRYGGRIEMNNGTVHKFMSAECTAGFYLGLDDTSEVRSIQVVDFAHGQQYLPAEKLVYLRSPLQPSPNGMNLTAIDDSNEKMKSYIYDAYPGTFYSWNEVLDLVKNEWELDQNDELQSAMK